ncbi:MAG: pro-sigmaK processing inhibitor BofA [Clostridia bacterium]|nr:pro-sigmaK processing inhibitor BofA [Clostridia bacterium]
MEIPQLIFAAAFVLFLLLIAARLLVKPLRLLVKLLFNSLIGLMLLLGFNFIGGFLGISIPVNIVTVLTAGFLGVPGLILLIAVKMLNLP